MGVGEVGRGMVSLNLAHFFKRRSQYRQEFVNFTENVAGNFHEIHVSTEQINLPQRSTVGPNTTRIVFQYLARSGKLPPV